MNDAPKNPQPQATDSNDIPKATVPKPRLWPLASIVGQAVSEATDAHEARKSGKPSSPVTGLKRLDKEIGGSLPKNALTIILGNTGAGKTAFAGQIAADSQYPTAYLTTEMAPVELLRRHTARESGEFLGRLKSGETTPAEAERLFTQTARKLAHLSLVDATTAYAPVSYLLEVMEMVKGDSKNALLVIDSLNTWARGSRTGASEYDTLNEHLTALIQLAKQARCSIVVICEQNRAAMKDGATGNPNAGAGTRFIEYSADLLFDLDAKKLEDGAGERAVTLTISKNRNGAVGKPLSLEFHGALQRFKEVEK